jgi:hypothetical protein
MSKDIPISKKYGFNPSVRRCFICGEDMDIAIFGSNYKVNGEEAEAPMHMTAPNCVCDRCRGVVKDGGVFFISVRDGETSSDPYRTGRVVAIKREAAERIFPDQGKISDVNYMEDSLFSTIFAEAINEKQEDEPKESSK